MPILLSFSTSVFSLSSVNDQSYFSYSSVGGINLSSCFDGVIGAVICQSGKNQNLIIDFNNPVTISSFEVTVFNNTPIYVYDRIIVDGVEVLRSADDTYSFSDSVSSISFVPQTTYANFREIDFQFTVTQSESDTGNSNTGNGVIINGPRLGWFNSISEFSAVWGALVAFIFLTIGGSYIVRLLFQLSRED